ncbi:MAG TPA: NAD(P)/FAD-dependent oxidoreductase [Pyrinomonadaceae bacterium]|jgi:thioredoxin reductase (NADPH)|nr:NAD(P)/FAD-dependent oxidoreductase [Pyrinomonadaceae bacterium]
MHDVIIIGGGPAGLSAALWCDELGLETLVLEAAEETGGQLLRVYNPIGNYLGLEASDGRELRDLFARQLADREFDVWTNARIESVDLRAKQVGLQSGERLQSIAIIIATGVRRRSLGVPGEVEFAGRGVMESGARDRDFFAGEDVCVVGGGDAAAENALLLAEVCPTVTLVHRGKQLRARSEFVERLKGEHCITVFKEATLRSILGRDKVEAVEILRDGAIKPFRMAVRGVLIRVGVEPNSELFRDQLHSDERGYVVTSGEHETSVENVFAVGDISNPLAPTISGATGAGATAAKVIASRLGRALRQS